VHGAQKQEDKGIVMLAVVLLESLIESLRGHLPGCAAAEAEQENQPASADGVERQE
jgi:hypothetical protein